MRVVGLAKEFVMTDETRNPGPGQPHTVKAGVFDALFGKKGPNGELMSDGKPVLLTDVPPDAGDDLED